MFKSPFWQPVPQGSRPHDVAPASHGGVWYTAQGSGELGWLEPRLEQQVARRAQVRRRRSDPVVEETGRPAREVGHVALEHALNLHAGRARPVGGPGECD